MIFSRAKYGLQIALPAIISCLLLLACENDLKKVQEISAGDMTKPVEPTTNVDLIFSDSAIVKYQVRAPLMLDYSTAKKPYTEMPKGVNITVYNNQHKVINTITSDYAKMHTGNKIIELHKNVVATNEQGDIFKSEELIYNQLTHKINSTQPVQILMASGDIINGTSFESNEKMSPYTIQQSYGTFKVNDSDLKQ
jgi:LPS export ABC transporter protein LptC